MKEYLEREPTGTTTDRLNQRRKNMQKKRRNLPKNRGNQQRISKGNRKRRNGIKKRSFRNYYIFLVIALLILLFAIISGNKKDDVSKYMYLSNVKTYTKNPIIVKAAKNSTAKVAILSLDDIKEFFDKDIRYDGEKKEIITIGNTHVARIILNDFAINLNGTESVINVSAFEEDGRVYLPLNDLSSVYGIEVFIADNDRVIVDNTHKEKKHVKVLDNTRLRKGKTIFSKTLAKLKDDKDYVLVEENKGKVKIRTIDGIFGHVFKNRVKNILEVRSDYPEDEKLSYSYIRNYANVDDNFDKVNNDGENKVAIIDIFESELNKNIIILSEKYDSKSESYKIYRNKLKTNNIEAVAKLDLEKYDLSKTLNTFESRQSFISKVLQISNKHNVFGVELNVKDDVDLNIYELFVEELKPRLKERGVKLFIHKDKIKSDKIKENIDYESE